LHRSIKYAGNLWKADHREILAIKELEDSIKIVPIGTPILLLKMQGDVEPQ